MNDPVLGMVIGLIGGLCLLAGYRAGLRSGYYEALANKKKPAVGETNGEPKAKVSWLRRNWFRTADPKQKSFVFPEEPRIRIY